MLSQISHRRKFFINLPQEKKKKRKEAASNFFASTLPPLKGRNVNTLFPSLPLLQSSCLQSRQLLPSLHPSSSSSSPKAPTQRERERERERERGRETPT